MGFSFFAVLAAALITITPYAFTQKTPLFPPLPKTAAAEVSAPLATSTEIAITISPSPPVRLLIPAIGLDAPIENVGTNRKGEMDVPDGNTNNVGWYAKGTFPGEMGSAVLDAHVFAAFKNLREVPPGSDVYVKTVTGETLHFVVREKETFRLSDLSPKLLFDQNDARRLNLITCAGSFLAHAGTYSHRLVLFAEFVDRV